MSEVVLVTGPPLAGVTSMVGALAHRMPAHEFVESGDAGAADPPDAVVFVVSAVAPMTESDCAVAVLAAAQTDVVVAVLAKIDDHRDWPGVLAANRERLGEYAQRFRDVPWAGAAAAPRLGEPFVDELVELLDRHLGDPRLAQRNSLRAKEFRLCAEISRLDLEAADPGHRARVEVLHARRAELLRQRGRSDSQRAIALRSLIQQTRMTLVYSARNDCAALRTELLEHVAVMTRKGVGDLEQSVRRRCQDIVTGVDDQIITRTREIAAGLDLTAPPRSAARWPALIGDPPVLSRPLETQLMTVLGAGFGLGVALVVSRLFAGLAPESAMVGWAAGGLVGLAVAVWVVRVRGLLHDRAVLDRWVQEVTASVRAAVEQRVAGQLPTIEVALVSESVARLEEQRAAAGQRLADIDAELAAQARAAALAQAARDRAMPALAQALDACRAALAAPNSTASSVTGR